MLLVGAMPNPGLSDCLNGDEYTVSTRLEPDSKAPMDLPPAEETPEGLYEE